MAGWLVERCTDMKRPDLDAFARLLDGDLPEGEATAEARALSSFARVLEASAAAPPSMAHKDEIRAMLVAAARDQQASVGFLSGVRATISESTTRWRYSTRLAAATGATAMALSGGGVSLAASRALPSDPFYSVKLAYEDVRLAFIGDPVARGQELLGYAEQRLVDARLAAADGDMSGAHRALAEADASSRSGAGALIRASQDAENPAEVLAILSDFAAAQRKRLAAILPMLSGDAAAAADDAMVSLKRINQRVAVLSGTCGDCSDDSSTARRGGNGQSNSSKSGGNRGAAAGDDFDFADIPPADEPFVPCPCVSDTTVNGASDDPKKRARNNGKIDDPTDVVTDPGTGGGGPDPKDPTDPKDPDPPGPGGGEEPGDGGTLPTVPGPAGDTVDDADEVIDEVIDSLPVTPPPTPDTSEIPDVEAPDLP